MRVSKKLIKAINDTDEWKAYKLKGSKIDIGKLPEIRFSELRVNPVGIVVEYHPVDPRIPWMRPYAWPLAGMIGTKENGDIFVWAFRDCDPFADEYPYTD